MRFSISFCVLWPLTMCCYLFCRLSWPGLSMALSWLNRELFPQSVNCCRHFYAELYCHFIVQLYTTTGHGSYNVWQHSSRYSKEGSRCVECVLRRWTYLTFMTLCQSLVVLFFFLASLQWNFDRSVMRTRRAERALLEWYCGYISLIGGSFTEECAEGPKWAWTETG